MILPDDTLRCSASVQTGRLAHLVSYAMGTGSFPGVKRPERGVEHPPHLCPMPPLMYHLCSIVMILKYRSGTVEFTQTLSQAVFAPAIRNARRATLTTRQE